MPAVAGDLGLAPVREVPSGEPKGKGEYGDCLDPSLLMAVSRRWIKGTLKNRPSFVEDGVAKTGVERISDYLGSFFSNGSWPNDH